MVHGLDKGSGGRSWVIMWLEILETECLIFDKEKQMEQLMVKTIEKILLNKFRYDHRASQRLANRINQVMSDSEKSPLENEIEENFKLEMHRIMARVIAERLMVNDQNVALISVDDLDMLLNEYATSKVACDLEIDSSDMMIFTELFKQVMKGIVEVITGAYDGDLYAEYWRMVKTVQALADDMLLASTDALSDDLYDEVTRRTYTLDQYRERNKKTLDILTDVDSFVNKIVQPLVEMIAGDDPIMKEEMSFELKQQVIDGGIRQKLEDATILIQQFINEEIARIYTE